MNSDPKIPFVPSTTGQEGVPKQSIAFHFGPQTAAAPETEYFKNYASGPPQMRMPKGVRELGMLLNNRRRAAANRNIRGAATAWIDEDDSGTYDPKKARRTPPSPPRPIKRVKTLHSRDDKDSPNPKKPTKQIGFRYSLIVKLPFESKKALNYLKTLPAGPSHPAPYSEPIDSDENCYSDSVSGSGGTFKRKRDVKRPTRLGATSARSDGLTIDQLTPGHPQRRGCKSCFEQDDDECSLIHDEHTYPCEACEDAGIDCLLIIPPVLKKICERCKKKRRSCSYRLDGGKGIDACDACEEEGVTCCAAPLLDEGWAKRFADAGKNARARSAPTSSSLEPKVKFPIRERMYISCNQCRSGGKRCTNKGKVDTGPCSNCRKVGQDCKFVYPPTRTPQVEYSSSKNKKKATASSSKNRWSRSPSTPPCINGCRMGTPHSPATLTATLYSELEKPHTKKAHKLFSKGKHHLLFPSHPLSFSNSTPTCRPTPSTNTNSIFNGDRSPQLIGCTLGITHAFITTAYCHPITFNYIPDPLNSSPCSWCENPFFGLYGLADSSGPRKVEGFYYPDGSGFEEIEGGYSERGHPRSVMCVRCTFERVRITQCASHCMRPLDPAKHEIDLRVFDDRLWEAATKAMQAGDRGGSELVRNAKWCSICPSSATMKCCANLDLDYGFGDEAEGEDGDGEGCGMLLCDDCAELMGRCAKGGARTGAKQVHTTVQHVGSNRWRYPEGVRADARFLTDKGELLVRMGQGMGTRPSQGYTDSEGRSRVQQLKQEDMGTRIGGGYDRDDSSDLDIRGKGKGKAREGIVDMAWQQLSARENESDLTPWASKAASTFKGKGKEVVNDSFSTPSTQATNAYAYGGVAAARANHHNHQLQSQSLDTSKYSHRVRERKDEEKRGEVKSRRWGGDRNRDRRGEIIFGGVLEPRREDVERALGGQHGFADLTRED